MSGRKQHFIPQSLLRAFGVSKGKKTYVVAYTFERGVFATPTDGVAAQRNFYAPLDVESEAETLDDKITTYEQSIPLALEQLRIVGTHSSPTAASELVTHLCVRNDHFRKVASTGGAGVLLDLNDFMSEESNSRRFFGIDQERPSGVIADEFAKQMEKLGPLLAAAGIDRTDFENHAFGVLKANFSALHADTIGALGEVVGMIVGQMPELTAGAQRKALSESLSPSPRVSVLSQFFWRTVEPQESVILPDCVAIGADANGGTLPLMLADLDVIETIYMPLAVDRLLVGSRTAAASIPEQLNELLASCSWDFFIARERTAELEALRGHLRSTSEDYMESIAREAVEESATGGGGQ